MQTLKVLLWEVTLIATNKEADSLTLDNSHVDDSHSSILLKNQFSFPLTFLKENDLKEFAACFFFSSTVIGLEVD